MGCVSRVYQRCRSLSSLSSNTRSRHSASLGQVSRWCPVMDQHWRRSAGCRAYAAKRLISRARFLRGGIYRRYFACSCCSGVGMFRSRIQPPPKQGCSRHWRHSLPECRCACTRSPANRGSTCAAPRDGLRVAATG